MSGPAREAPALGGMITETGIAGLMGACLVGIGEFCLQFSPGGGYEDPAYGFLAGIARADLDLGYMLSVFAAPLYLVGYWHLKSMLAPASRVFAWLFFLIGAYSFVLGAVWIGQRPFLALTVQSIEAGEATPALLAAFAARNEILVNVLRAAVAINGVIWIGLIVSGRSLYPRWMAAFAPGILLALVFAAYVWVPGVGVYLLATAMNVAHVIVFALSLTVVIWHQAQD